MKKAFASHEPPKYVREPAGSVVDAVAPQIRALLAEFPEMPTSVIMGRVGWARGKTAARPAISTVAEQRSLTHYDRLFGLAGQESA